LELCQACKNMGQTRNVTFRRNVGMLFLRKSYKIEGNLCKPCIHSYFWKFSGLNLLMGPWGTISLVLTPIYLVQNVASYVGALHGLRGT
jgi:hypothetical protein